MLVYGKCCQFVRLCRVFFFYSLSFIIIICRTSVCHVESKTSFVICTVVNFCSCHKKSQKFLKSKRTHGIIHVNNNNTVCMQFIFTNEKFHWTKFFSCCHILRKFFRLHNKCYAVLRFNKGSYDEITWGDFHLYGSLTAGIQ